MTLIANALTTVAAVKVFLEIEENETDRDAVIEMLINAASERLANECQREFGIAEYTETKEGKGRLRIFLDKFPVIALKKIKPDTAEYNLLIGGCLEKETGWNGKVEINYTAGYILPKDDNPATPRTLPHDLELAAILFVAYLLGQKDGAGLTSEQYGPMRMQYSELDGPLPLDVEAIVGRYRQVTLA